ncbi:MAG: acyltransferase [Lachnospiraceae bacterium]|nr:acyltransferase [Lachnospiraceae bacterium]
MFQFIIWLRAIAAMLITNSHYADIWPISKMAFGGHIGNCIFFFVSGFCLYDIKEIFPKWYVKRIIRIYPALWIAATVSLVWGQNSADSITAYVHCYLYPTWYHFIASIMVLYCLLYLFLYIHKKWKIDLKCFMGIVLFVFLIIYASKFNHNLFHIESIDEKWVWFQFMEAMLVGAVFRDNYDKISGSISFFEVINVVGAFVVYVVLKVVIPGHKVLWILQILLPFSLLWLIVFMGIIFIKLEKIEYFKNMNDNINRIIVFISSISLEIYLCQYVVIAHNKLGFPISFLVVTGEIILYAWIVHLISTFVQKRVKKIIE